MIKRICMTEQKYKAFELSEFASVLHTNVDSTGMGIHLTSRLVCSYRMLVNARETCLREIAVTRSVIISTYEMKLLISKG